MTTKRLNIKFLAILGAGTLVFLVATKVLHDFQVQRNAAGLLRRAEAARADGDLDESARLRIRFLSHVPGDAEQYKQVMLDLKKSLWDKMLNRQEIDPRDVDLAFKFVGEAVTFNGQDEEVRREASEFWYMSKRYNVAVDNLEKFSENWTDDDRMRYINSLRLMGGPMEEQAMAEFRKTIGWDRVAREFVEEGSHPHLLDAYQSLVTLLLQRDLDRESAVKVLDQMVALNSDKPQAYLNRARLIRAVRGADGVESSYEDIQTAYEKAPEDLDVIQAMSEMMLETDRAEDAKRLVKLGLDQAETIQEKARLFQLLAEVHIRDQDIPGALDILDRANREVPRHPELLWSQARLLLDEKRFGDVEAMYKPLKDAGQPDAMIGYLQARILMAQGNYQQAVQDLEEIRNVLPGLTQYEADIYLSEAYGYLGKIDKQLLIFRSLHERNPDNERVNEGYVKILLQLGRSGDAQEFLNTRIAALTNAGKPIPQNYQVLLATLRMHDAQLGSVTLSDAEQAEYRQTLRDAAADESLTDAQRLKYLLQEVRQTPDPQLAKTKLKQMINKTPESYEMWQMLINYAEDMDEATKFYDLMKTKVDAEQFGAAMEMMKVQLAAKYSPESLPEAVQQLEGNLGQFDEQQQLAMLYQMAQLSFATSQREQGIRLYEKVLEHSSANLGVKTETLNTLFEDALTQADVGQINTVIDRIRKLVGENDEAYRIVEARRIVWNIRNQHTSEEDRPAELRRARDLIQSIRTARSEWLPGILVEADLQLLDNNPSGAIELLEVAHNIQRNNAQIIRSIAMAYRYMKQTAKAEEWMRRLPSTMLSDDDNRQQLMTLWVRRTIWTDPEREKATQLLEQVAPAESTEWKDQMLRSQFYLFLEQLDKAELAAKQAAELSSELPDVWINWMTVCVAQKDNAKATQVIQLAAQKVPEDQKLVTLGRCFAIAGDLQKAASSLAAALNEDKENATIKRLLAETLMRSKDPQALQAAIQVTQSIIAVTEKKTAEGETVSADDQIATIWARRTLATILSNTNNYQNFLQALTLLENNAVNGELSREDITFYVAFCNKRPEQSSWDRAILRLEQIAQTRSLNDLEIFMKAQIYEKYGDQYWGDVKKMATDVLSRNGANKALVESYVRWLLKRGEVKEAETLAQRNLDRTAVTRFRVDVHSDAKQGNFQRAAEKIQERAPKQIDTAEEKSEQLMVAAIAEELGQYDERFFKMAEALLRKLAAKSPADILRVATLIGNRGDTSQINEALQICVNAHQQSIPSVLSADAAINILRKHSKELNGALAPSVRQLSQWMEKIMADNASDLMLKWRVADFYELIGNLDRAEATYQAILDSPDFKNGTDRGMVLNNLAYAMALNGKGAQSMELIQEAEKLLPPSADLIDTKGYIHLVLGETDQAISAFQQALKTGPKNGHKYFHLALAFRANKNREQAEATWKAALANGLDRFQLPPALRTQYDELASEFGGVAGSRESASR